MPVDRTIEYATLSALLESLPAPALIVDRRHRIRAANSPLRARVPPGAAVTALRCFELLHGVGPRCPTARSQCPLERCLGTGHPVPAVHAHLTGRATRLERILLRPLVEDGGRVVACLGTLEPASAGLRARGGPAESEVAVEAVRASLPRLARGRAPVLLVGETGTGKASVARAIHRLARRLGPFEERSASELTPESLRELLAAIPPDGTLYVGDLEALDGGAQGVLWEFLAGRAPGPRIIAGADRGLAPLARSGRFRHDLSERLAARCLRTLPLRERAAELPRIAARLLRDMEGPGRRLSVEALQRLRRHPFPGNLDELVQVLRHASLMADGALVQAADLPSGLEARRGGGARSAPRGRRPRGSTGR